MHLYLIRELLRELLRVLQRVLLREQLRVLLRVLLRGMLHEMALWARKKKTFSTRAPLLARSPVRRAAAARRRLRLLPVVRRARALEPPAALL